MIASVRWNRKVNRDGPVPNDRPELGPCWLWTATCDAGGYGRFWFEGRLDGAHRAGYLLAGYAIADGLELDHLCRRRDCVNPDHMEPVTRRENIMRGRLPAIAGSRNRAKAACPAGHPYDDVNTYRWSGGGRRCRACGRLNAQRYRAVRKAS